jgi:hypothetical protein
MSKRRQPPRGFPYLLNLPPAQQREILSIHAARIRDCELCGKPIGRKVWIAAAYQVDPENNSDTLYLYRLHARCLMRELGDPQRRGLLRIEQRAESKFPAYLASLFTVGGTQ